MWDRKKTKNRQGYDPSPESGTAKGEGTGGRIHGKLQGHQLNTGGTGQGIWRCRAWRLL